MPSFAFTKLQGLGNDFVVVDLATAPDLDWRAIAPMVCDRRFGVGADGILLVSRGTEAPLCMQVVNADGSLSEMCGNGLRCVAAYAHRAGLVDVRDFMVETGSGLLSVSLEPATDGAEYRVRVGMGAPRLSRAAIPMQGADSERVVAEAIAVGDRTVEVTAVSMGNPHAILVVDDVHAAWVDEVGPLLEGHSAFPRRSNVEFVQVVARDHLKVRVFERGVGWTLACGTGACASVVAASLLGVGDRAAQVELPGGTLDISWQADGEVVMTGPAREVFSGRLEVEALPA